MDQYFGNYLGIVIQNNDPEKRGRVKVFVPHVSYGQYEKWDQLEADKIFKSLQDPNINDILEDLRSVLPWAEVAGPLFGGNASGRYNSTKKKTYTSNSNIWEGQELVQGNRPTANYIGIGSLHDGFNDASKTGVMNPYTFEYTPSDYSNLAAGTFSIPNVGAHVWVFFEGGDSNLPVYWASGYSQADYKRIYTTVKFTDESLASLGSDAIEKANISVDYPNIYENLSEPSLTPESKTFRAKHVINTNKHSIELIDTDNREILKFTHFSGSFKEWNNYTTTEFAANNDQKLVLGDQFETVKRSKNIAVSTDYRLLVNGDSFLRVGNSDFQKVQESVSILNQLNEYKQLFDRKRTGRTIYARRTGSIDLSTITSVNGMSRLQTQQAESVGLKTIEGVEYYNGFVYCPVCTNTRYEPQSDNWVVGISYEVGDPNAPIPTLTTVPVNPTSSSLYTDLQNLKNKKAFSDTEQGIGYWLGGACDVCNSDFLNEQLRRVGFNPSTEHGLFKEESAKVANGSMYTFYQNNRSRLSELLASFSGGDQIIEVHKNKIETVGLVMNTSPSFRIDPIGKLRVDSVFVAPEGTYTSGKPSPHIESVDVAEVPGGNYIVTAANKLKFVVGAKGINIKTFGPLDMYGGIVNFTGEQINIGSQNEINIDAGEKLFIRSRKTTIVSKDHEPVMVESPLHVSRNVIVRGGIYVEGQCGLLHIATLREYGITSGPTGAAGAAEAIGSTFSGQVTTERGKKPRELKTAQVAQKLFGTGSIKRNKFSAPGGGVSWDVEYSIPPGTEGIVDAFTTGGANAAIGALASQLAALQAFVFTHVHLYERIPGVFFDSAEELRAYLNDPSAHPGGATINSRSATIAAAPVTGFTGIYGGIAQQALKDANFDNKVDTVVIATYATQGSSLVPPITVTTAGPFVIPPGGANALEGSALSVTVNKTYVLSNGGKVTMVFNVSITVDTGNTQEANVNASAGGTTVTGSQSVTYNNGSVVATYQSGTGTPAGTTPVFAPPSPIVVK